MNKIFTLASMSRRIKKLELSPEALHSLDFGYLREKHIVSVCVTWLYSLKKRSNAATTGFLTDMRLASVNCWVKRYQSKCLSSLYIILVQGCKLLIVNVCKESVLAAIKADRQNVQAAKAVWEASSGKERKPSCIPTFFLSLADDVNV